jgi:putative tryptophan/tyrosine transport system substrate-binding protein
MMNRRTFLCGLPLGTLAAPLAAEGQPAGKVYRIGLLGLSSRSDITGLAALRQGLRDLGYEEGKNLVIDYRWAEGNYDRLPTFAEELVQLKVDVLVTYGTPGARAAKRATTTIPIVVALMGDAVAMGSSQALRVPAVTSPARSSSSLNSWVSGLRCSEKRYRVWLELPSSSIRRTRPSHRR